jgi:hypothetical protein
MPAGALSRSKAPHVTAAAVCSLKRDARIVYDHDGYTAKTSRDRGCIKCDLARNVGDLILGRCTKLQRLPGSRHQRQSSTASNRPCDNLLPELALHCMKSNLILPTLILLFAKSMIAVVSVRKFEGERFDASTLDVPWHCQTQETPT